MSNLIEVGPNDVRPRTKYIEAEAVYDEIERLQARVEKLEAVKEAAQEALECLYFHGFEPGEDPRISNLAGAMLVADGTLAATEQGENDDE